ncbi:MAG TPA: IgGFc-binding protein, partial [Polyangiaceae bacterium]|nr:IgGFc-binding protein [Polyangiaceae bacterium]
MKIVVGVVVFGLAVACGDQAWNGQGADAGDAGVVLTQDAMAFGDSAADAATCSEMRCSADLHQVIGCSDEVVQTCPPDLACAPGGKCVAPCDGAAANQSAVGCDFYGAMPAPDSTAADSCYTVLVANTWSTPIDVQVEWNGIVTSGWNVGHLVQPNGSLGPLQNGKLNPGEVGAYFLAAMDSHKAFWTSCPGTPAISTTYTHVDGSGIGHAFHITTSAPVVAYDMYPYGGALSYITSASLLLPTPTWGTNYVAADGYARTAGAGSPYVQIIAAEDDTQVTIAPTADIVGGTGVAPAAKGQPQTYALDKGELLQIFQNEELAGSPIASNKPITVFGGASCADVPTQSGYCDSLHQQLPPVQMLGSEYVAVRYRNRGTAEESVPWRFVGAVDGTTLTFDPPQTGAPATLAQGQLVELWSSAAFRVTSQDDAHPFYVSGHMTGCLSAPTSNYDGDPDYVNVVPPKRWLGSYLFLTDATYGSTNLVFVRSKAKDGTFKDVNLDCVGTLGGWTPIGSDAYEYT